MNKEDFNTTVKKSGLQILGVDGGALLVVFVFASLSLPLIFLGQAPTVYSLDQELWHLPAIRQIAGHWPMLDLRADSLSAIAPGYHYFLATLAQVLGTSELPLRLVNWWISLAVIVLLYIQVRRVSRPLTAGILLLPLAASNFFVKSASWIVTDNISLLLVALTLVTLCGDKRSRGHTLPTSLLASCATAVRQVNVWLVAPISLGLALDSGWIGARKQKRLSLGRILLFTLFALLPGFVVAVLFHAWGGLVPPAWRDAALRFSFCPIAYLFTVAAILVPPYCLVLGMRPGPSLRNPWAIGGLAVGFLISLLSATSYSPESGRWGGWIWVIVEKCPVVCDRSIFIALTAPVGAASLAVLGRHVYCMAGRVPGLLWCTAVASWGCTFLINRQVFHRYYEPQLLVFCLIAVLLASRVKQIKVEGRMMSPMILLVGVQILFTLVTTAEAFGLSGLAPYRR